MVNAESKASRQPKATLRPVAPDFHAPVGLNGADEDHFVAADEDRVLSPPSGRNKPHERVPTVGWQGASLRARRSLQTDAMSKRRAED